MYFMIDRTLWGYAMQFEESVSGLVGEYRAIFASLPSSASESLEQALIREGDWTPQAAEHLVTLANKYGSFMLRNALATSLALEIEDGDLGF